MISAFCLVPSPGYMDILYCSLLTPWRCLCWVPAPIPLVQPGCSLSWMPDVSSRLGVMVPIVLWLRDPALFLLSLFQRAPTMSFLLSSKERWRVWLPDWLPEVAPANVLYSVHPGWRFWLMAR